jgi:hypothetical protein
MEPKRKIVIPLGGSSSKAVPASHFDGEATVPAPFFDAEATIAARPVVPLSEAQNPQPGRFPLLALVIILAVSAGVAGGFAIGVYKSRQNQASAATNGTAAATTTTTAISEDPATATTARQLPSTIASEKTEPETARDERAANQTTERTARDSRAAKDDEQVIPPVEVVRQREKEERASKEKRDRVDRDNEKIEREETAREVRKQQKREQRRRVRDNNDAGEGIDRQVERAGQELNRIRDIFEGQRP